MEWFVVCLAHKLETANPHKTLTNSLVLAHHGVNITQFISCHTDTILIINRREALKAYTVLEKLILSARRLVKTSA
ncbi:MAG: hypothetical protein DRJ63_05670 [Thermoprotei archaeon]|nr:MAG: hypothetical protein DRJ63_05670 [Thermoprotei archaeon]